MVAEDIQKKIVSLFGEESANGILCEIERFNNAYIKHYKQSPGDRVIRAVLLLSEGSLSKLRHFLGEALMDYRDILYWAEYDTNDRQIHDCTKPFS